MQTVGSLLRLLLLFFSYWSHETTCAPFSNHAEQKKIMNDHHSRLKRDESEDLRSRIQRDELYHHALSQGLLVLGPDPESDESDESLKEIDRGHQEKRSAKFSSNEYGDYNLNPNYEYAESVIGRHKRLPMEQEDEVRARVKMAPVTRPSIIMLQKRIRKLERKVKWMEDHWKKRGRKGKG